MRITTESGSVYEIDEDSNICTKYNANGTRVDSFRVYFMEAVSEDIKSIDQISYLSKGEPQVGKRMYISGKDSYWISTKVVSITWDPYRTADSSSSHYWPPERFRDIASGE